MIVEQETVESMCMWKLEVNVKYLPQLLSMGFFEAGSFTERGPHQFVYAGWTVSPGNHLCLPPITKAADS